MKPIFLRQALGIVVGLLIIAMLTQLRPVFVDATVQPSPISPISSSVLPMSESAALGGMRTTLKSAPAALPIPFDETLDRDVTARHVVVIDANTGEQIGGRGAGVAYPMASLTKLLAALVVVDRIEGWKQLVEILPSDIREGETVVHVGDRMELYDLFVVTLVRSSNTGVEALARSVGFTRGELTSAMNAVAAANGWTTIYVTDPTGLSPTTVGSAADIARILAVALSRREIASALGTAQYQWSTYSVEHVPLKRYSTISTNELIHPTAKTVGYTTTGGKTGYIPESGYNIAVEAVNAHGRRLIAVVLGAATFDRRFVEADALLRWAFDATPSVQPSL